MTDIFENATSVVINNKEVESIITQDGGTLYQKPSPSKSAELILLNTPPIYVGDTVTFKGIYKVGGVPVSGKRLGLDEQTMSGFYYVRTTDSNGEVIFTKNNISAGSHTVYLEDDDAVIPSSAVFDSVTFSVSNRPVKSLSLSSNKSILSYADSDSATLTATLTEGGVPVEDYVTFKMGDTVLDTIATDSNGQAMYYYSSRGSGDVTITASCGQVSDDITIEDCILYDSTSHTGSDTSINLSLPNEFVITWESNRKSSSTSICRLLVGADDSNCFQCGSYGSQGYNGLQERINGTWQTAQNTDNSPLNTIQYNTLRYGNGSLSYSNGSQTVSKTPTITLSKLLGYGLQTNGLIQNLKVKSL